MKSMDDFEEEKYQEIINKRESLHILKKISFKYNTILNALEGGDIQRAKDELKEMFVIYDRFYKMMTKKVRREDK